MPRQNHFQNTTAGLSGCIRAVATEPVEKGTIVYISEALDHRVYVSPADAQYAKRSTGLLFVAHQKSNQGQGAEFVPFLIVPFYGDGEAGDTLYLTKNGKWGTKKTKTAKPVGKVLKSKENELMALIAPQGQY